MDVEERYERVELIGKGSFATVYRAKDKELGREVAIKEIHPEFMDDPEQLTRYWDEAQLLASLQHPNIVTIYDIYRDRGWLIMELMQSNLSDRLQGEPMDLRALKTTVAHCLRALKYLHSRGVTHGDLKPSNFMIDHRRRVKIGDFGLARRASDDEGSLLKGTTKYMAPEVVSDEFGEIGPASDLYSLGFAAYDLMCGENFETLFPGLSAFGRNKQVAWMMWHAAPDRRLPEISRVLEGVPPDLATVIQRLCEKKQDKRFKTADEALDVLKVDQKIVKDSGAGVDDPDEDGEGGEDEAAKKKRLIILSAVCAVSLIMSMLMLFLPGDGGAADEPTNKSGTIREVLLDENTIVIVDDEGVPEEVSMGKKPRIVLKGFSLGKVADKNILLRQLLQGDQIEVETKLRDDGSKTVTFIVSRPVESHGEVTQIDTSANTMVVLMTDTTREEIPLRVPERAKIFINGKPDRLVKVKPGDVVDVSHLPEAGRKIGRIVHELRVQRLLKRVGFLTGFDSQNRTITYSSTIGNTVNAKSLPLTDSCSIKLMDVAGSSQFIDFDQMKVNDRIEVEYFEATGAERITITRDKEQYAGVVHGVNGSNVIVQDNRSGAKRTFDASAASATILNEAAQISDIRKGDSVSVSYQSDGDKGGKASRVDVTRRPEDTDRWAVIIANQAFDSRYLSKIPHSNADGDLIKNTLIKRYFFKPNRILQLEDAKGTELKTELTEYFKDVSKPEQVVVYVATHGYVDANGDVYVAAADFNFDDMKGTGIPLAWIIDAMEACVAEDKILYLDLSHSGSGKDLLSQPSTQEMVETVRDRLKTVKVIASCKAKERGLAWSAKRQGLFAYLLAEGFSGKAETEGDERRISAKEMATYLGQAAKRIPIDGGFTQTPTLTVP